MNCTRSVGGAIQLARCAAPPSPYDLNPDEGEEGQAPSPQGPQETVETTQGGQNDRLGTEGQSMGWGQRLKVLAGMGRASNADYVGVATTEQGQQGQQLRR